MTSLAAAVVAPDSLTACAELPAGDHRGCLAQLLCGRPIVVVGQTHGEVVVDAAAVTAEVMAFLVRYTSGYVCISISDQRARELQLPQLSAPLDVHAERFAVSVDAARGVSTGISAADRSHTARLLADVATTPDQLTRPGHLVPIRVRDAVPGLTRRPAEWAWDLIGTVTSRGAVVSAALVSELAPTELADPAESRAFALRHALAVAEASSPIAVAGATDLSA